MKNIVSFVLVISVVGIALGSVGVTTNANPNVLQSELLFDTNSKPVDVQLIRCEPTGIDMKIKISSIKIEKISKNSEDYYVVKLGEYGYLDTVGKPQLPVIRMLLAIPPNCKYTLNVRATDPVVVTHCKMYPLQEDVVECEKPKPFIIDKNFYDSNLIYPDKFASISCDGYFSDYRVLQIEIYPIQYDAYWQKVTIYRNINLSIKFSGSNLPNYEPMFDTSQEILYKTTIMNYEYAKKWVWRVDKYDMDKDKEDEDKNVRYTPAKLKDPNNKADYLIITDSSFYNDMIKFADYKAPTMKVIMANVSQVTSEFGGQKDVAIHDCIQYAFENWAIKPKHVLLVGDVDTIPPHNYGNVPSDSYYSFVKGNDFYPDINVARFSVKTTNELTLVRDKVINYNTNPPSGEWRNKISLVAHEEGSPGKYERCKEELRQASENTSVGKKYTFEKLYAGQGATLGQTINAINEGRVIVNYRGHGDVTYWASSKIRLKVSDVNALTNGDKLSIVYNIACLCGKISSDCLAEAWQKAPNGGAIATIGATQPSYTEVNHHFDKFLFKAYFTHGLVKVGDMYVKATCDLLDLYGANHAQATANVKMYLMLGDTETTIVGASSGPVNKPDLTTTSNDISFSNPTPKEGDSVDISAIIRNVGKENASNVNVSFYVGNPNSGGVQIGSTQNVGDILVGQTKTAKVTWDTNGYGGNRDIYVICDSTNSIPETNEKNNTASKSIYVYPKNDVGTIAIQPFKEGEKYALGKYDIKGNIKNFGCGGQQPFDVECKITKLIPTNNVTVFNDDMESGGGQWTEQNNGGSAPDTWHIVTGYSHSQTHSWWCGPPSSNGGSGEKYSDNVNRVLLTPKLDLSGAKTAMLTFWHRYNTEPNADYCYVERSDDGGSSWNTLEKWSGQCMSFVQVTVFLTAGNDNVKLRFRFESNSQNTDLGWYIDDVKIVRSGNITESVIHTENKKTSAMNPDDVQTIIWNYDFSPHGECGYRVAIKTLLPNDSVKINDQLIVNFTMVNMKPPPTILLKSPTGGEKWKGGSEQTISWNIKDGDKPYIVEIYYSENGGVSYIFVNSTTQNAEGDGSYKWHIPTTINSDRTRIKVVVKESGVGRTSEYVSGDLLIDSSYPQVSVESPETGIYWNSGKHTINWTLSDNFGIKPNSVQISYSQDGGTSWSLIVANINGTSYVWDISNNINSQKCFIKVDVQDIVSNIGSDISEMFTIDTTIPTIEHQPVSSGLTGEPIPISAVVKDNFGIKIVKLNYKGVGSVSFTSVDMIGTNTYSGEIPAQSKSGIVEYYICAEDKATNNVETQKYKIEIKDASQFGSISGSVRDATTGKPIGGAKVTAFKNGNLVGGATTNSKGSYKLAGLSPDTYIVRAETHGYKPIEVEVVVASGKDTVKNFELYPENVDVGNIKGVVVDKNAQPIKDATVSLNGKSTKTDKNGEFMFRNLKPGEYTLKVSKPEYEDYMEKIIVEPEKTKEVRITLYKKGEKQEPLPLWIYGAIGAVIALFVILPIVAAKRRKRVQPLQYQYQYQYQYPPPPSPLQLQPQPQKQYPYQYQYPSLSHPIPQQENKICKRCGSANPYWALSCMRCKSGLG